MRLQFKHQKFQADAAKAVVDVFAGQPYLTPTYMMDRGINYQQNLTDDEDFTGWRNEPIVPELSDKIILERLNKIQRINQIEPSAKLERSESCKYNLTIEMETGVGKTYTYIKTMYELNKHYGWSKFIVVVPSIAIREGVYKSFQVTQEHFAEEYGKKIRFFIYNSSQLTEIDRFASDSSINVMIINSQAFNARGKDARRIYMKLDEFRSRRPIDIIAKTNPILIIDEPQSVEGKQTKERLKEFHPLLTLRYSATHKADSIYNMVYRLDAMEAYNKRLVKKISVMLDERYDTDIFTEPTIKGKLGANAMKAQRHLYDHIVYDSTNERDFASELDTNTDVAVYVKLPDSFYISTPVGHYNPDWAIAFYEGTVKHIYFVAETKGSMRSMQLRQIEESKIHCAREHFKAISGDNVVYDVVDSYETLLNKVMK